MAGGALDGVMLEMEAVARARESFLIVADRLQQTRDELGLISPYLVLREDGTVERVSLIEWVDWWDEQAGDTLSLRIAYECHGDVTVSTVFLGIDASVHLTDPPERCFEAAVYVRNPDGGRDWWQQMRTDTLADALMLHEYLRQTVWTDCV